MKTFLKTVAILFAVACFGACSENGDDYTPETEKLEVTPHNISGYWKLTEINKTSLPEGTFCYIEYIRKDKTFKMYHNFDSMYPRCITGVYSIENDANKGDILSGKYDFGNGEWNNKYFVVELLEESMSLVADNEDAEACKYERCNEIPAEILEQAK